MTPLEIVLAIGLIVACAVGWRLRQRAAVDAQRHERELTEARSQQQSRVEAERLRAAGLFEQMIDGIIILDRDGRIELANRAVISLFDMAGPMLGHSALEATRRHEVTAVLTRLANSSDVVEHELRLERKGETRLVQVSAATIGTPGHQRDGALLVFRDLTRLRKLEAVREDFVANVSHELRTPLSLIKSASETLIDGAKNEPATRDRFLTIIDQNANRLALLIDDLLLLARLDSGRLELHRQVLGLRALVDEAMSDSALLAQARRVALVNEVPAAVSVTGDPARLRQVLINLLDNSIKYGRQDGRVAVSGRTMGAHVEIAVRDDGPGIPPEAQARIFERFYRVDKARAREHGGTGLGLAIVKNVVEAHGGQVRVESTMGQGTTFYFTLSVAAVPAAGSR